MEQSHFLSSAVTQMDEHLKDELFTGRLSNDARDRIKNILKTSAGLYAILVAVL